MGGEAVDDEGYRFGAFHLLPERRRLLKDGDTVPLTQRAIGILIVLVERHDRIVTKDELFAAVWQRAAVEEHNLAVHISTLRKVIGPDMIVTIPGRGYKFTAPLEASRDVASEAAHQEPAPVEPSGSPAGSSTNLPRRLTAVIGREAELTDLVSRIGRNRLVTVSGPSGIGKTRLAIELGWRMTRSFPGGVWRVDLAPLSDAAVVVSAVASALGVALRNADAPVDAIAAGIDKRRLLLILDNCEHLVAAVASLVEALLQRVGGLSVVTTSRESLRIPGEQTYRLNPLALPPRAPEGEEGEIARFGAIALFVERAQAADRGFVLAKANAPVVVEICRRLDGIPLALEMAAARIPLLGVEGLRARLGERLRLFGAGHRTTEWRHRTLRDTVAWSYGLLDDAEQRVFRRLGVFAGDFSLDAALDIAGEGDQWGLVDAIGRLIDKSLVTTEGGEEPRYRLLETLRLYALEQLEASGEAEAVHSRHAEHYTALFDRAFDAWEFTSHTAWQQRYEPEIGNVRAALEWAQRDAGRPDIVIRLTGAAALYWDASYLVVEGRAHVDRALSFVDGRSDPAAVARLHRLAGALWRHSDHLRAAAAFEQSVSLYRELGDGASLGRVQAAIGGLYALIGDHDKAVAALTEALALLSPNEQPKSLLFAVNNRGVLALLNHDLMTARDAFLRTLELADAQRDALAGVRALANLAEVEFSLGAFGRAVTYGREGVARSRRTEKQPLLGWLLANLASYLIMADGAEARAVATEALTLLRQDTGYIVRVCLQQWALFAALDRRYEAAARLLGFVDAAFAAAHELRQPNDQVLADRIRALLQDSGVAMDWHALGEAGARWRETEAVTYVFETLIEPQDAKRDPATAN